MSEVELRTSVSEHLQRISSPKDLYSLFSLLGYSKVVFDHSAKRRKSEFEFKKEDIGKIREIYSILSFKENLSVFLFEVTDYSRIRSITTTLSRQYLNFLVVFTVNYSDIVFAFPDQQKVKVGSTVLRITKLVIDKKDIHYTDVCTIAKLAMEDGVSWREVWKKWKAAFSVKRVTEEFFERYKKAFFSLRDELRRQRLSPQDSHEFSLQFLNRIMFLYFIAKKSWLGNTKFVDWLWKSYKIQKNKDGRKSDTFYDVWLKQVFFKAFNNNSAHITDLPDTVIQILSDAPYLNGGLFKENRLDTLPLKITDNMFTTIFDFFESYNFTIREDSPLDQEVAVDPQMIGYVYETLANLSSKDVDVYTDSEIKNNSDSRKKWGIYYTPKIEVDFMCKRSLVEYLSKQMTDIPKEKIYHLIFDLPEEKDKIHKWFDEQDLWERLEESLENLSVVDPACGSGAFLVGMLNVVSELYSPILRHAKREITDFEMKKRIIQYSLYGVDVMPWAISAAELRLWLQLIVEAEFKKEDLRKLPLLPNLNLNLRIGDSLVQEIGGLTFNVRTNNLKLPLKRRLDILKQEKRKYYENSPSAKFRTPEEVRAEEIKLFEEIIDDRIESLKTDIMVITASEKKEGKQVDLFGSDVNKQKILSTNLIEKSKRNQQRIESSQKEIENLQKLRELLHLPDKKPFVWDIDFAEIFGDKRGFDIVIGNPPYVRQEKISPPDKLKNDIKKEDKKAYKEKLFQSVKSRFSTIDSINRQSDYYIYFYFHGLSLLNENGTFCFITSNSWLDVEYGAELQSFLCKYVPIIALYDNPKRSFEHAQVNTIITLLGAPVFKEETREGLKTRENTEWPMLNFTAKFVMFKKPFEEVLSSHNLIEVDNVKAEVQRMEINELVKNVTNANDYRIFPITQSDLLQDGWEYPENYKNGRFKAGKYDGNKWGGKYLRASELLLNLFGKNCISKIPNNYGKIITVAWSREGHNDEAISKIEKGNKGELILKSPKDSSRIEIKPEFVKYIVFTDKIENKLVYSPILMDDLRGDKHLCRKVSKNIFFSHAFHGILPFHESDIDLICGLLNSSLSWFLIENLYLFSSA